VGLAIKKILLIKLRHHGDVLLQAPLVSSIRYFFPDAQIDLLIYEESKPLFIHHPDIHFIHVVSRSWRKQGFFKRVKKEFELIRNIQKAGYDTVFNLTEGDRGALYAFLSHAKTRIGEDPMGKGFFGKKYCYTHSVRHHGLMKHTVEMQLDFLRKIKLFPPLSVRRLELFYSLEDKKKTEEIFREKTVLLHPVSRWMFKACSIKTMKAVLNTLLEKGYQVVLTGSKDPEEMHYNQELSKGITNQLFFDLTGKLSLLELSAAIDQASFVITVDSLPMHIAAAKKKPTVAIFGPTSPVRWGPWQNPNAIIVSQKLPCQPCYQAGCHNVGISDCLEMITKDEILEAFSALKEQSPSQDNGILPADFQQVL
jgi:heptosyltransferase-3